MYGNVSLLYYAWKYGDSVGFPIMECISNPGNDNIYPLGNDTLEITIHS